MKTDVPFKVDDEVRWSGRRAWVVRVGPRKTWLRTTRLKGDAGSCEYSVPTKEVRLPTPEERELDRLRVRQRQVGKLCGELGLVINSAGASDLDRIEKLILIALSSAPDGTCDRPPEGWYCTREKGHDGPCAACPR